MTPASGVRSVLLAAAAALLVVSPAGASRDREGLRALERRYAATASASAGALRFCRNYPTARAFCTPWRIRVSRARLLRARAALQDVRRRLSPFWVPDSFRADALCVHDGWRHARRPPFERLGDVPDGIPGGSGESEDWRQRGATYRGGMQFHRATWARADGSGDPADASPAEQVYRAYVIVVRQDAGSWAEWPETSRACGLR